MPGQRRQEPRQDAERREPAEERRATGGRRGARAPERQRERHERHPAEPRRAQGRERRDVECSRERGGEGGVHRQAPAGGSTGGRRALEARARSAESEAMRGTRDPILLVAGALALAVAVTRRELGGRLDRLDLPGLPACSRIASSPRRASRLAGTRGGEIYQHEVVAVDGRPLRERARRSRRIAAERGPGVPIRYGSAGAGRIDRAHDRDARFAGARLRAALRHLSASAAPGSPASRSLIRFLGPRRASRRQRALALDRRNVGAHGARSVRALPALPPARLLRVPALRRHAPHGARVPARRGRCRGAARWIPSRSTARRRAARGREQIGLYDPAALRGRAPDRGHRLRRSRSSSFIAAQVAALVAAAELRGAPARQGRRARRARCAGAAGRLEPQVRIDRRAAPENAMGWSGIFFPLSIGYAVLRDDLLEVDAILRRSLNYALLTSASRPATPARWRRSTGVVSDPPAANRAHGFALALRGGRRSSCSCPLRDRMQAAIDRVFFRSAYDFRRLVEARERAARVGRRSRRDRRRGRARPCDEALQPEWIVLRGARSGGARGRRPRRRAAAPGRPARPSASAARRATRRRRRWPAARSWCRSASRAACVALLVARAAALGRLLSAATTARCCTRSRTRARSRSRTRSRSIELRELNRSLERKVDERTAELAARAARAAATTQAQLVHQREDGLGRPARGGRRARDQQPAELRRGQPAPPARIHARACSGAVARLREAAAAGGSASGGRGRAPAWRSTISTSCSDDLGLGRSTPATKASSARTTIVKDLRTFSRLDSGARARSTCSRRSSRRSRCSARGCRRRGGRASTGRCRPSSASRARSSRCS